MSIVDTRQQLRKIRRGCSNIAEFVKIQGRNESNADVFRLFRDWLRDGTNGKCLLVLDNVDDADFLFESRRNTASDTDVVPSKFLEYTPVCEQGSVLITSRSEDAAWKLVENSDAITVTRMRDSEGVLLLEKKLDQRQGETDFLELVEKLECMPLAITQAAAYIKHMGRRCSLRQYLDKLWKINKSKQSILDNDAGDLRRDGEACNSIILTWQISFEHVTKIRPSAADLLSLLSFCDRQAIPESLVRQRRSSGSVEREIEGQEPTRNISEDNGFDSDSDDISDDGAPEDNLCDSFDKDIRILEGYSFVSITTDPSVFEMHRLVQVATRKWLESQGQLERWKEQYITNLCALLPPGTYKNWAACQVLFPHAQSAIELKPKSRQAVLKWATVMYNAAWYALMKVGARDAEKLAVRSLKVRAKVLGEDDADTLSGKAMVALARNDMGRWNEAEQLEVQVLETRKKLLGEEHPDTLTSMGNIALTYVNQGRLNEAEELQVRAMKASTKVLGAEHLDTLTSIEDLASTYRHQGRWNEAEQLEVQVMETRKKLLGAEHPDTLTSMNNLALTYKDQGRWDEAEDLGVRVVETRKKVLGEKHPNTLTSMENLAHTLKDKGNSESAHELMRDCALLSRHVSGSDHPLAIYRSNILARWEQK